MTVEGFGQRANGNEEKAAALVRLSLHLTSIHAVIKPQQPLCQVLLQH